MIMYGGFVGLMSQLEEVIPLLVFLTCSSQIILACFITMIQYDHIKEIFNTQSLLLRVLDLSENLSIRHKHDKAHLEKAIERWIPY